jgi:hypothetical protein
LKKLDSLQLKVDSKKEVLRDTGMFSGLADNRQLPTGNWKTKKGIVKKCENPISETSP